MKGRPDEREKRRDSRVPTAARSAKTSSAKPAILHSAIQAFRPSKRLGQNFLVNRGVVDRIVAALAPEIGETIIEIGPGTGALTAELLERAGRVIAVEFDRQLVPALTDQFSSHRNFVLIHEDALETDICSVIRPATQARLVANLPYNISTAILQRLIEQRHCLKEMILMLQREVVERIAASPGSTERGFLSVRVQTYCEIERLFDVAPGSFRPVPKVWSSVVRLRFKCESFAAHDALLFQVVSAGFAQKRKTILNNLRNAPDDLKELFKRHGGVSIVLCEAGVEPQRRAETLTIEEWRQLAEKVR